MHTKTLKELYEGIKTKQFSSLELTQHFIKRIKNLNNKINGFLHINEEYAIEKSKKFDKKKLYNGGIPFAHKDIICTTESKTTCASKMLQNFTAPYNATIHKKLLKANFIPLGKTNMDEFAMGSSNEKSIFGKVYNPWNNKYVSGGSSGGAAACISSRLIPAAIGTDTGGSIRQPAAFCGVTGLKPTYGLISRFGIIAFASSLDQAGPIGKTAEDCAILLEIIAGYDEKDSTSIKTHIQKYSNYINNSPKKMIIGIPKEFIHNLNNDIKNNLNNVINIFKELKTTIKYISLPNIKLSIPAYYIIAPAECSSNLSRYDGIKYGYKCINPLNIKDLYSRSRFEGFGEEVIRRIMIGTYVLSSGYYNDYYIKAQKIRAIIRNDYINAFKKVNVIIGPTTPNHAFKINSIKKSPTEMYKSDIYTCSVNLAGLPAISIPTGFVNNLPVGLQIIGNYLKENEILNLAHQYQLNTEWHKLIPKQFIN
ncbi:MAG: Asp-tRNA(Asn)/Glu-tRNA(Gln) amidotransferase subunit GatA [Candidatus Azosocius agrarius]|nr:MAG: Asp-tRNA(Asn)/Glu-tRNA(Gln) amidotransferase subunit GatA [Gammaproteobacteria bacterium]